MDVATLRPDSSGDLCEIMHQGGCSACPNHYDCVYEAVADGDTTRVYTAYDDYAPIGSTKDWLDSYNLEAYLGSGDINKVTVYAVMKRLLPKATYCRFGVRIGSTNYMCSSFRAEADYSSHSYELVDNPATEVTWTAEDIQSLQVAITLQSCNHTDPDYRRASACTQVYIEVDYIPAPPPAGRSFGFIFG